MEEVQYPRFILLGPLFVAVVLGCDLGPRQVGAEFEVTESGVVQDILNWNADTVALGGHVDLTDVTLAWFLSFTGHRKTRFPYG